MNSVLAAAVFLPPILTGALVANLAWDDRRPAALALKLFVGIGLGIGLNSLLYFLYLLAFARLHFFIVVQLTVLLLLLVWTFRRARATSLPHLPTARLDYWTLGVLVVTVAVSGLALAGALTVWGHRPSGTWDAFMIYNRTARFVFRNQADWRQSFSAELDPVFHADYPLLMPLSIVSGWDTLARESQNVPRYFSAGFIVACAGLLASALSLIKSPWQAAAGLIVLLNTPLFLMTGASQTADVPLAYFILATAVLLFLYASQPRPGLMALAGLAVGLAAWTKNEGQLFVLVASFSASVLVVESGHLRDLGAYLAGMLPALAIVAYFKIALAPPNDLLAGGLAQSLPSLLQLPRHLTIIDQFVQEVLWFGQSWIWVGLIPLAYGVLFGLSPAAGPPRVYLVLLVLAVLQLLGYYFIFLITPHPLSWQLEFSLDRLLLHVYPVILFIWFALVTDIAVALGKYPSAESVSAA